MDEQVKKLNWQGRLRDFCNWEKVHCALEAGPRLDELGCETSDLQVLISLARRYNEELQESWPSYSTMADDWALSRSTAKRCIKRLKKMGAIVTKRTVGNVNYYDFRPETGGHTWATVAEGGVTMDTKGVMVTPPSADDEGGHGDPPGGHGEPGEGHGEPGTGVTMTPEVNKTNQSSEVEKETKPGRRVGSAQKMSHAEVQTALNAKVIAAQNQRTAAAPKDAATELAQWFYELIGEPSREREAAKNSWPTMFRDLVAKHNGDAALIRRTLLWASEHQGFWASQLARKSKNQDSAVHAVEKLEDMLHQVSEEADRKLRSGNSGGQTQPAKHAQPQPQPQPPSEMARKFKSKF